MSGEGKKPALHPVAFITYLGGQTYMSEAARAVVMPQPASERSLCYTWQFPRGNPLHEGACSGGLRGIAQQNTLLQPEHSLSQKYNWPDDSAHRISI